MKIENNSGIVQFYNEIHGNGFIIPDNGSERIKFSYRSIKQEGFKILNEGQRVRYGMQGTKKGPIAINIVKIEQYE